MSDEQKTTQETPHGCCEGRPRAAMMEKMMSQHKSGCNCAQMMSQNMGTDASNTHVEQSDSEPEPRG